MGPRRRRFAARPLIELASTVAAVAVLLAVSFVLDYTAFRVVLAIVTVAVASMWVIARR